MLIVLIPLITLKSLFNVSTFNPNTALPIHLFSWNKGLPPAVYGLFIYVPLLLYNAPVLAGLYTLSLIAKLDESINASIVISFNLPNTLYKLIKNSLLLKSVS